MAIDFALPVYQGGYNMAAEGFQHEMMEIRQKIQELLLGEDAIAEIINAANDSGDPVKWGWEYKEAQLAEAVNARIEAGDHRADELIAEFESVREKIRAEWGLVE